MEQLRQGANPQGVLLEKELLSTVHKLIDPGLNNNLPEEYKNRSPLDSLEDARAWLSPVHDPDDGAKYGELTDELDCYYDVLLKIVPADKQRSFCNAFGVYLDCMSQLSALEKDNFYKIGLRDGFLLAVELLSLQSENKAVNRTGLMDIIDRLKKAL